MDIRSPRPCRKVYALNAWGATEEKGWLMCFKKWQALELVGKPVRVKLSFHADIPPDCLGKVIRILETAGGWKIVVALDYARFGFGISPHEHALNRREWLKYLQPT